MDQYRFDRAIMEIRAHLKLINWLAEQATVYQPDVIQHVERIADLTAELSQDAFSLAAVLRDEKITENGKDQAE